jgi:hypothetical protein
MTTDAAATPTERLQIRRIRTAHRHQRELKEMIRECAADPSPWRLRILDAKAAELAEAVAQAVALDDDSEEVDP